MQLTKTNTHPRPQLLMAASMEHNTGQATDCKSNGNPNLEGRSGTENWEQHSEDAVWKINTLKYIWFKCQFPCSLFKTAFRI